MVSARTRRRIGRKTSPRVFMVESRDSLGDALSYIPGGSLEVSVTPPVGSTRVFLDTQSGEYYRKGKRVVADRIADNLTEKGERLVPYLSVMTTSELANACRDGCVVGVLREAHTFSDPTDGHNVEGDVFFTVSGKGKLYKEVCQSFDGRFGESQEYDLLEAGIAALGGYLPGAPVPNSMRIDKDDTVLVAGARILKRQAYKMKANAGGAARDLHPEFLHDLRVASRRARFALRMLADDFGKKGAAQIRGRIAELSRILGPVRDHDVFIGKIGTVLSACEIDKEVAERIVSAIHEQRAPYQAELVASLTSESFAELVREIEGYCERKKALRGEGASTEARSVAHGFISKASRKVLRSGAGLSSSPDEKELHCLRIAIKNLRYVCEFFEDFFGDDLKKLVRNLIAFQDCLGAQRDSLVACMWLDKLSESAFNDSDHQREREAVLVIKGRLLELANSDFVKYARLTRGLPRQLARLRDMEAQFRK